MVFFWLSRSIASFKPLSDVWVSFESNHNCFPSLSLRVLLTSSLYLSQLQNNYHFCSRSLCHSQSLRFTFSLSNVLCVCLSVSPSLSMSLSLSNLLCVCLSVSPSLSLCPYDRPTSSFPCTFRLMSSTVLVCHCPFALPVLFPSCSVRVLACLHPLSLILPLFITEPVKRLASECKP